MVYGERMAKHLSVLRRFEVYSERDDGGVRIEHRFKDCDWDVWIAGYRLTDLMRQATSHARVCDGKPQPKPERLPGSPNPLVPDLWSRSILSALETRLAYGGTVSATGANGT